MTRIHPANAPSFSTTGVIDVRNASLAVHDQYSDTTTIRVVLSS